MIMEKFEKLKQIKVLYVEDEEDIRNEIVDILCLKVQNIFVAQNGQEGYESYLENKPDIRLPLHIWTKCDKEI